MEIEPIDIDEPIEPDSPVEPITIDLSAVTDSLQTMQESITTQHIETIEVLENLHDDLSTLIVAVNLLFIVTFVAFARVVLRSASSLIIQSNKGVK